MMSKIEREQLEALKNDVANARLELIKVKTEAATEIERLKKELESQRGTSDMYRNSANKAEQELESAHSLLDGLPQAPAAETVTGAESWQRKNIPLTTRLASWIAKVAFSEAFARMGVK